MPASFQGGGDGSAVDEALCLSLALLAQPPRACNHVYAMVIADKEQKQSESFGKQRW